MIVEGDLDVMEIVLDCEWLPVLGDSGSRYSFPNPVPQWLSAYRPTFGVYRWIAETGAKKIAYVGEAENYARRLYQYLKPGPSQRTNLRLHETFTELVSRGVAVTFDIMVLKSGSFAGTTLTTTDSGEADVRRLLEAVQIRWHRQNCYDVLNAR